MIKVFYFFDNEICFILLYLTASGKKINNNNSNNNNNNTVILHLKQHFSTGGSWPKRGSWRANRAATAFWWVGRIGQNVDQRKPLTSCSHSGRDNSWYGVPNHINILSAHSIHNAVVLTHTSYSRHEEESWLTLCQPLLISFPDTIIIFARSILNQFHHWGSAVIPLCASCQ